MPEEAQEVPPPSSPFSTSATRTPRKARSRAIPAPLMPPPTTRTCVVRVRLTGVSRHRPVAQTPPEGRVPSHAASAFAFPGHEAEGEFIQLRWAHHGGGVDQQVLAALRLWKRDHVAQALRAGKQHHEAIDAEGEAAVGWRARVERVQHESEALLRLGLRVSEDFEDPALHIRAVVSKTPRPELHTV